MSRERSSRKSQLPTKWAVALVAALIGYAVLQPVANGRLGWNLPSLASLLGENEAAPSKSAPADADVATADLPTATRADAATKATHSPAGGSGSGATTGSQDTAGGQATTDGGEARLRYGLLRESSPGSEDYVSPGGLRYTKGSAEGHRLKHLDRHLKDIPDRPGKHGVFDGDMPQVLRWLDEAYVKVKEGDKSVRVDEDRSGTKAYTIDFGKTVGYVGGRDGNRQGHPDARRIKLVLSGNRVITAYPF